MKQHVLIALVALLSGNFLFAQTIISGFEAPESVIKHGDKLYVSNIGGAQANPMALDSNGFISELSADGKMITRKFSKAVLNAPKGLAIAGNSVYAADVNRIVGFDLKSGDKTFDLSIPNSAMLNDLCTINDKTLAVSETVHGQVFIIHLDSKTVDFAGSIGGANGLTYDPSTKQLYACGMGMQMNGKGKLYVKNANSADTVFTELPNSPTGIFDGLEFADAGHLIVTDWIGMTAENKSGRFIVYDLHDHSQQSYKAELGPADLYYDKASHMIYLHCLCKISFGSAT